MEHLTRTLRGIAGRGEASLFIDGEWRKGSGGTVLTVVAPHSEDTLLRYTEASIEDIDMAVAAARRAFDQGPWPRLLPAERGAKLKEVARLLEARLPELAEA